MQTLKTAVTNVKDHTNMDMQNLKTAVANVAARATATEGGGGTGHVHKANTLVTLKETTVDKLPDTISKVDFDNWVEELYVHIDRVESWAGMSYLLEEVRLCKQDINEQKSYPTLQTKLTMQKMTLTDLTWI